MPERTYRVFISSTFQDLASHREAVAKTVLQLGGIPFALESFAATGEPVAEAVKDALTQSDVAIFIVGHRYGAIIPNTGKSWVEAEYDTARSREIPTFVFMPGHQVPGTSNFSSEPENPHFERTPERAVQVKSVRRHLTGGSECLKFYFSSEP